MPEKKPQDQGGTPDQTPDVEQPKGPVDKPVVAEKLDESPVKGGKYIVNDRLVNANGEPIDEQGNVIKPS